MQLRENAVQLDRPWALPRTEQILRDGFTHYDGVLPLRDLLARLTQVGFDRGHRCTGGRRLPVPALRRTGVLPARSASRAFCRVIVLAGTHDRMGWSRPDSAARSTVVRRGRCTTCDADKQRAWLRRLFTCRH